MRFLKTVLAAAVASTALMAPLQASATAVTFDSLTMTGYSNFTSYSEAGYTFTLFTGSNASQSHVGDGTGNAGTLNWHDDYDNGAGAYIRLTRTDNASFDLLSFDYATVVGAESFGVKGSTGVSLNLAGSTSSQTSTPNWSGLAYADFFAPQGGGQIDNLNVQLASSVPEPETYALMIAGLGMLGFMGRRRRA